MSDDRELETWKREWQALGGRERLAEELAARVTKDGRRIRNATVREITAGIAGVAICVWLLARARGELVTTVISAAACVGCGIWVTRLLTLRQGSFKSDKTGLDAFIDLTRRRMVDDAKWHVFGYRTNQLLLALLPVWTIWALAARAPMYRAEPWRAIVGFGVPAIGFTAFLLWGRRKRRKLEAERERFDALVAERTLE